MITKKTSRAWIAWVLVVFGLLALAGTSHDEATRVFEAFGRGEWRWTPASTLRAVRVYLTNERDEQRYFAYMNACLGRPYQPYFVRPLASWHGERVSSDVFIDTDAPPVTPTRPLVPYRDFLVEYPPGFFLWALPPALFAHTLDGYHRLFMLWMALLASASLVLCVRLSRRPAFARASGRIVPWMTASAFALGIVVTHRYDATVALLLCLAVWGALEDHALGLGVALGLAAATKGTPLLAAPPLAWWLLRRRRWRALAAAAAGAATALLVVAPFFAVAGRAVLESAQYHVARPLQIESTGAALVALLARPSLAVVQSYGSVNLVGAPADWARGVCGPLALVAIAASYGYAALRLERARDDEARERALVAAVLAPLAAFMLTAKVFSPQYLVWLLPLAVLATLARGGGGRWLWLGICVASQIIYPAVYPELIRLAPWMCALLLARNFALGVFVAGLLAPEPAPSP
jgi:hypothetical protein